MNRRVLNKRMIILAGTVLVTTLMMTTTPTLSTASTASPDFTIETFGIVDKSPSLTVQGTAGGTIPDKTGDIFAYVFFTDDGIYAVTSHPGIEDSNEVKDDADWHAHKVQLNDENCVTDLQEKGKAELDGNTVSVEKTKATDVTKVLTALLVAEGDNVCVDEVFDSKE